MMTLQRFARPMFPELRREVDRVFENFLGHETPSLFPGVQPYPALNLWEDGENLYAEAELPGLRLDDLEILIQGNELTLKGQRAPMNGANVVYHRRERGTGEFVRFMTLPVEVNADKVEAQFKDGVLSIVMPKAEQARARKISVKTA